MSVYGCCGETRCRCPEKPQPPLPDDEQRVLAAYREKRDAPKRKAEEARRRKADIARLEKELAQLKRAK